MNTNDVENGTVQIEDAIAIIPTIRVLLNSETVDGVATQAQDIMFNEIDYLDLIHSNNDFKRLLRMFMRTSASVKKDMEIPSGGIAIINCTTGSNIEANNLNIKATGKITVKDSQLKGDKIDIDSHSVEISSSISNELIQELTSTIKSLLKDADDKSRKDSKGENRLLSIIEKSLSGIISGVVTNYIGKVI